MYSAAELSNCTDEQWFKEGYQQLERNLLLARLGLNREPLPPQQRINLKRFSQAVIGSAPIWENPREGSERRLCQLAADIEASLAISEESDRVQSHIALFKSIVLYDLAGLPGTSASFASRNGFDPRLREFFNRSPTSLWGTIAPDTEAAFSRLRSEPQLSDDGEIVFEQAIGDLVQEVALRFQQGDTKGLLESFNDLTQLASHYSVGLSGDDLKAVSRLVELREENSSLNLVPKLSTLDPSGLRAIGLPLELWPAQVRALRDGLLDEKFSSFGFAAPTGTGKTALTKLLIADAFAKNHQKKVLYICPSRALVHQVSDDLQESLSGLGLNVLKAGAHLVAHDRMPISSDDADVIVFTPERADLLLRIDPEFLQSVCLVVVDEAHHIEQGPRGVLLEFYLWRLRKMISNDARIVQLSAVAPNISELTDWISLGTSHSVMLDWCTSRLRVGVLERTTRGGAILNFSGVPYGLLPDGTLPLHPKRGLAVLANHLAKSGIVLVLCSSPAVAEEVAGYVGELRSESQDDEDEVSERLDAWIERELYPESELRALYQKRVVFHHAQMPPRVRQGLEEAIRERKIDVICATTTLAEGVNFPFSTVVVETLVSREFQLTPRSLWNIAGRAGRFGVDSEGHCILFRPALWVEKLTEYKLDDYMQVALAAIPPVRSALALGIERLDRLVSEGKIDLAALEDISLAAIKIDNKASKEAKAIRALVNIVRVGYAHANSSGLISLNTDEAPEFVNELLASRQLPEAAMKFALSLGKQQRRVVSRATEDDPDFVEIAARVGWSLEAQQILYAWLRTRENWQLEQFGNIVVAGYVRNFDRLGFLIGPVAKHLIAFEGEALGGAIAFLAEKWIRGIPLASFQRERGASFGRMVSNIYGRMQYLLPWGLFGMHELLQYEARLRSIRVSDGLSSLSVLAAEGVSNFDSLQLVLNLGIERVDATRLAERYKRARVSADISDWLVATSWAEVERIVKGVDSRRVDPSLKALHRRLRETTQPK
jgi:hypothetical protein